jgi:hypothetical protein
MHVRHLMLEEGQSATRAAFAVGYESVPQFTRESFPVRHPSATCFSVVDCDPLRDLLKTFALRILRGQEINERAHRRKKTPAGWK